MIISDVYELDFFEPWQTEDLDQLISELGEGSHATSLRVKATIESKSSHLYVVSSLEDTSGNDARERIIACATLCVCQTPEMIVGNIEAVVVSPLYRGKHIGRVLMQYVIDEARKKGITGLHLTSSHRRVAANGLYQSLGFKKRDTNYYTMNL
mgnify:FL=1